MDNEYYFLDKPINEIILDNIRESKINRIAWSDYFGRYIRCVKYISNTEWYFEFIYDESENLKKPIKAKSPYDSFKWSNQRR